MRSLHTVAPREEGKGHLLALWTVSRQSLHWRLLSFLSFHANWALIIPSSKGPYAKEEGAFTHDSCHKS